MNGAIDRRRVIVHLKNFFIVAFFGAQLWLALPGLLHDKFQTQGQFSWNMYSVYYRCKIRYELITGTGRPVEIDVPGLFHRPEIGFEAFHRDSLPRLHDYLCAELRHPDNIRAMHGSALCLLHEEQGRHLIQHDVDLCSAPNRGVLPE
jgi:hypothetical protein